MKYKIELLTPVHIGNGDQYTDMDSVVSNDYFYAIDTRAFYEKLQDMGKLQGYLDYVETNKSLADYLSHLKEISPENVKKYSLELTPQNRGNINLLRKMNVSQFIKNATGEVYIPGSELKGAIRTALIYDILYNDTEAYDYLKNQLEHYPWNAGKYVDKLLETKNTLYDYRERPNAKKDLMRFILIGDSDSINVTKLHISHLYSLRSERKDSYCETLEGGALTLEGSINIIKRDLALDKLGLSYRKEYLNKNMVLKSIYNFSDNLIKHEISFAREHSLQGLEKFYGGLKTRNVREKPLLRIGMGQGFLSTTINLIVEGGTYPKDFPKTRRVVKKGEEILPLGWVKFGIEDNKMGEPF